MDCRVGAYTQVSALGTGLDDLHGALAQRTSGLTRNDFPGSGIDTWIGRVSALDEFTVEEADFDSRNNALIALGLAQDGFLESARAAVDRFGACRVGVAIGTSTSSIGRTEEAYASLEDERMPPAFRQKAVHNPHSPGAYTARLVGANGPQMTISTACSSSAKVFATAWRWLKAGIVDAVVVGGADTLCHSVLAGFNSLELVSPARCQPFDLNRSGINLGEAAGFALLSTAEHAPEATVRLAGYGESSDAHHMSHPAPGGTGAKASMGQALAMAGLDGSALDYVNLHGTASQANDAAEAEALSRVMPATVAVSSTKGWSGHTLGAAGILEAVITLETLRAGLVPGTLGLEEADPSLAFPIAQDNRESRVRHVMTNSFGFGGNNCSLLFSRAA